MTRNQLLPLVLLTTQWLSCGESELEALYEKYPNKAEIISACNAGPYQDQSFPGPYTPICAQGELDSKRIQWVECCVQRAHEVETVELCHSYDLGNDAVDCVGSQLEQVQACSQTFLDPVEDQKLFQSCAHFLHPQIPELVPECAGLVQLDPGSFFACMDASQKRLAGLVPVSIQTLLPIVHECVQFPPFTDPSLVASCIAMAPSAARAASCRDAIVSAFSLSNVAPSATEQRVGLQNCLLAL